MSQPGVARQLLGAAALFSIGAGFIHASVISRHVEHPVLAYLFVAAAAFQIGWGIVALTRPSGRLAVVGAVGNLVAFGFWLTTRFTAVGFIDGLDHAEEFGVIDTICGILALTSALFAIIAVARRDATLGAFGAIPIGAVAIVLALSATVSGVIDPHEHEHGHAEGSEQVAAHDHATSEGETDDHAADHPDGHVRAAATADWPRPWDPSEPIDLSGVAGVTAAQEAFGVQLIEDTMRDLPTFASTDDAVAAGYRSINDAGTGVEHYINWGSTSDGRFLDSKHPESLVYEVTPGDGRKLVSAMYIAEPGYALGTERLDSVLGPLTTWHVHDNLCFRTSDRGGFVVAGLTDAAGVCADGLIKLPSRPMVHVWIAPHKCGPFAALEGVGAGQASQAESGDRVDSCSSEHAH